MPENLWPHAIEAVAFGVGLTLKAIWDDRKSKKHNTTVKRERNEELDHRLTSIRTAMDLGHQAIREDLQGVVDTVKDLSAHVIGPDGQNGLRGEVREIKAKVDGLLDREPRRRQH